MTTRKEEGFVSHPFGLFLPDGITRAETMEVSQGNVGADSGPARSETFELADAKAGENGASRTESVQVTQ